MMRVIVTPAVLPPSALAELKQWLGITTTQDDAPLPRCWPWRWMSAPISSVSAAGLHVEETIGCALPHPVEWQVRPFAHPRLASAGQHTGAPGHLVVGCRPMARRSREDFEIRIDASGACQLRIDDANGCSSAVVSFEAGLAADWDHLPQPLHHGIIRLAAHQYRMRDSAAADALPPASVTALWRPYRRMRLA
jgi:hypothetical protein